MSDPVGIKIEKFFSQYKPHRFRKGEVILRADDSPSGVYFIKEGYVVMTGLFEDGREITFNIFKPGTYFPIIWAIAGVKNSYYYTAMTQVVLQKNSKEETLKFLKKDPEVLFELTSRILVGMGGLLTNIEYILTGNSYRRIISVLTLSARRFGEYTGREKVIINIPLTHKDIANMSGLTRETVSLGMKKLERKKLISVGNKRQIIIENIKKLEKEFLVSESEPSSSPAI